jgi:hypothetical protein
MFRKRRRLNQKEPPHVFGGELLVCSFIHCQRGRDVHEASLLNLLGMIETESVRHTRAAIMSRDKKTLVTEMTHHIDLILRRARKPTGLPPWIVPKQGG